MPLFTIRSAGAQRTERSGSSWEAGTGRRTGSSGSNPAFLNTSLGSQHIVKCIFLTITAGWKHNGANTIIAQRSKPTTSRRIAGYLLMRLAPTRVQRTDEDAREKESSIFCDR